MATRHDDIADIVDREGSRLRGFIRRRVRDPRDAEDILQDVWPRRTGNGQGRQAGARISPLARCPDGFGNEQAEAAGSRQALRLRRRSNLNGGDTF